MVIHQGDSTSSPGRSQRLQPGRHGGARRARSRSASPRGSTRSSPGTATRRYNCTVTDPAGNPRPVIQGSSFGRLMTVVDLKIDTEDARRRPQRPPRPTTRSSTRDRHPGPGRAGDRRRRGDQVPRPDRQPAGRHASPPTSSRAAGPSGESRAGQRHRGLPAGRDHRCQGAQVALMNPGGVRADLTYATSPAGEGDGVVTYGEAFTVQPFNNLMQTITLTGAQLDARPRAAVAAPPTARELSGSCRSSSGLALHPECLGPVGSRVSDITRSTGSPVRPGSDLPRDGEQLPRRGRRRLQGAHARARSSSAARSTSTRSPPTSTANPQPRTRRRPTGSRCYRDHRDRVDVDAGWGVEDHPGVLAVMGRVPRASTRKPSPCGVSQT